MACEDCVQSVSQIFGLHRFRVAIVIDSTLVLKSALLVKRENVWGADCAVFLRDFLCVVSVSSLLFIATRVTPFAE